MSRDYELAKIPAESPTLIAYVRQLHLSPRPSKNPPQVTTPTDRVEVMDKLFGEIVSIVVVVCMTRLKILAWYLMKNSYVHESFYCGL